MANEESESETAEKPPVKVTLANAPADTLWIVPQSHQDYERWIQLLNNRIPSNVPLGENSSVEFYLLQGRVLGVKKAK